MSKVLILFFSFFYFIAASQNDTQKVASIVDEMPEFPGGVKELMLFIQKNINYPQKAKEQGWQGRVYVKFIIKESGIIDSIWTIKSSGYLILDNEAIRVVRSMPKWAPGKQNGKPVPVYFDLPINFSLNGASFKTVDNNSIANSYYNLGVKAYGAGKYDEAVNYYKKVITINPSDIDALYNCGAAYFKLNEKQSACEMWNKIKSLGKPDANELLQKYCTN